jgi:hypothetical protein
MQSKMVSVEKDALIKLATLGIEYEVRPNELATEIIRCYEPHGKENNIEEIKRRILKNRKTRQNVMCRDENGENNRKHMEINATNTHETKQNIP